MQTILTETTPSSTKMSTQRCATCDNFVNSCPYCDQGFSKCPFCKNEPSKWVCTPLRDPTPAEHTRLLACCHIWHWECYVKWTISRLEEKPSCTGLRCKGMKLYYSNRSQCSQCLGEIGQIEYLTSAIVLKCGYQYHSKCWDDRKAGKVANSHGVQLLRHVCLNSFPLPIGLCQQYDYDQALAASSSSQSASSPVTGLSSPAPKPENTQSHKTSGLLRLLDGFGRRSTFQSTNSSNSSIQYPIAASNPHAKRTVSNPVHDIRQPFARAASFTPVASNTQQQRVGTSLRSSPLSQPAHTMPMSSCLVSTFSVSSSLASSRHDQGIQQQFDSTDHYRSSPPTQLAQSTPMISRSQSNTSVPASIASLREYGDLQRQVAWHNQFRSSYLGQVVQTRQLSTSVSSVSSMSPSLIERAQDYHPRSFTPCAIPGSLSTPLQHDPARQSRLVTGNIDTTPEHQDLRYLSRISSHLECEMSALALGITDYQANSPVQTSLQREESRSVRRLSSEAAEFRPFAAKVRDVKFGDYTDPYVHMRVSAGSWGDDEDE